MINKSTDNESVEGRKYKIVYEYVKNAWIPFRLIEMKHAIFTFILEHDYETMSEFINKIANEKIDLSMYRETYIMLHEKRIAPIALRTHIMRTKINKTKYIHVLFTQKKWLSFNLQELAHHQ